MMKRVVFLITLSAILATSCKQQAEMQVYSLNEEQVMSPEAFVYALPRTVVNFEVIAEQQISIPGPYYPYAEKYLGISNVTEREEVEWRIRDLKMAPYSEPDPKGYYVLEPAGKFAFNPMNLAEKGLIIPMDGKMLPDFPTAFFGKNAPAPNLVYTDLSVKQYVGEERKTYYKRVKRDSLFAKVPVVRNETVYKSYEEKAEEAANFIFLIREKRFELLSGMAELTLEGEALKTSLQELNRLEEEYLALFIGKRLTKTYTRHFQWAPSDVNADEPIILFRFSEDYGVLPEDDMRGRPVYAELTAQGLTAPLKLVAEGEPRMEGEAYMYYRVPDRGQLRIVDGGDVLARKSLSIHQLGEIMKIPLKYLQANDKFIEFLYKRD